MIISDKEFIIEPERRVPVMTSTEVLVVGGSPTGVAAAVAAARNGVKVLLVEWHGVLGGTPTTGLVFTLGKRLLFDGHGGRIVAGLVQEIIDRCMAEDGAEKSWVGDDDWNWEGTWLDPEVLKLVLVDMLLEAGVDTLLYTFAARALVENRKVCGIIIENKSGRQAILADIVIDASGDADIAASAGVLCDMRAPESISIGWQPGLHAVFDQIHVGETLDYLLAHPEQGEGMPVKDMPGLVERWKQGRSWGVWGFDKLVKQGLMDDVLRGNESRKQGKVGFLWIKDDMAHLWSIMPDTPIDGTDMRLLTQGEFEVRQKLGRLRRFFRQYVPGFESAVLLATPCHIGVRETRRIAGKYTLTERDVRGSSRFTDAVAQCAGHDQAMKTASGFDIPYRCLVPKGVSGLLVAGRCISAEAPIAFDAVRGIIGGITTGQAAGTAAALALRNNVPPTEVNVTFLQQALRRDGVLLK